MGYRFKFNARKVVAKPQIHTYLILREHIGHPEVVSYEVDYVALIPLPVVVTVLLTVVEVVHELVRSGPAVAAGPLQEQDPQWRDDRISVARLFASLDSQRFWPICAPSCVW